MNFLIRGALLASLLTALTIGTFKVPTIKSVIEKVRPTQTAPTKTAPAPTPQPSKPATPTPATPSSATKITPPSRAQKITVTSPNGGEVFTKGQTVPVSWSFSGFPASTTLGIGVKSLPGLKTCILQYQPANLSTLNQSTNHSCFAKSIRNQYKIIVFKKDNTTTGDQSDNFFTINPSASTSTPPPPPSSTSTATTSLSQIRQNVKVTAISPITPIQVGLSAGQTIAVFKITNNNTSPVYFGSPWLTFLNSGSTSTPQSFSLFSSVQGGTAGDTSITLRSQNLVTTSTSPLAFDNIFPEANQVINGGAWRYLTIRTRQIAHNNDTFRVSTGDLSNLKFYVKESDFGQSLNSDSDLNDFITDLSPISSPTSTATVTAKT